MIGIEPDWRSIIGMATTLVLGCGVGPLVAHVGRLVTPLPPPSDDTEIANLWSKLYGQKTVGHWIGFFELLIYFAAFWLPSALLIMSSWLVFKLALYWQNLNLIKFPDSSPSLIEMKYLVAKRVLCTYYTATLLVGTGANIVVALVGVTIGHWIHI